MGEYNNEYKKLQLGSKIMVHAYKLNGWLYRAWEYPILIYEDNEMLVLDASKAWIYSSEERSIRSFKTRVNKSTYWYFFKKEWFNIIVTEEDQGMKYYINIASPFIYEQEAIKYYDFDLDFKIMSDATWKEVDVNEFIDNASKYEYGEKLINVIKCKENKLKKLIEEKYFSKLITKDAITKMLEEFKKKMNSTKEFGNEY